MSMTGSGSGVSMAINSGVRRASGPRARWAWACLLVLCGCETVQRSDSEARAAATPEPITARGEAMPLDEHKALVTKAVLEIFNQRHYAAADTYVARDFHSHNPQVPPGPEGIKTFARQFGDAFADFRGEVRELVAEGDKVMMWIRWQGRHTGTFAGVPATGNAIEFDTVEIFRIRDRQLVEHWDIADRLALLRTMGALK
jgi:predicted ester cyclase